MPEPETYQKRNTGTSLGEKNRIPWEEIHHAAQGSKLRDLGGRDAYVFSSTRSAARARPRECIIYRHLHASVLDVPMVYTHAVASFLKNTTHTTWGFPKVRGTLLGVPIIRIIVFCSLYQGPFILGNNHVCYPHDGPHTFAKARSRSSVDRLSRRQMVSCLGTAFSTYRALLHTLKEHMDIRTQNGSKIVHRNAVVGTCPGR